MTDNFNDAVNSEDMEMDNVIMLTDEDGNDVPFEFLDVIEYQDAEYVVLMPMDEDDDSGEVVILQLIQESDDEDTFVGIDSEEILSAVFAKFKENFKDILPFADDK